MRAVRVRWRLPGVISLLLALTVTVPALTFASVHRAGAKPTPRPTIAAHRTNLRLSMPDEAVEVDPALPADENQAQIASLLYSGLVRLDAHYHVVLDDAARYTISPDHRTYTFYLRKGLRFSNGDPITAQAYRYSIQRSLDPALHSPSAPTYLLDVQGAKAVLTGKAKSVSGIKVINSLTLQITARWPITYFLLELTYPTSYVVDPTAIARYGKPENTGWYANPVTSGPYKLKSLDQSSKMQLVRNPYYKGPRPALANISISLRPLSGDGVDLYQYVTQHLDVATLPSFETDLLARYPGVHNGSMLAISGVYFSMTMKPFDNVHVRRALTMAIDRKSVVSKQMGSWVTPFGGFVPPGEAGYDHSLRILPYDPARARNELKVAGYPGGKGFPSFTLYYGVDLSNPSLAGLISRFATAIAKSWQKNLKITVDAHEENISTIVARAQANSLPVYLSGWTANFPDPHDWLSGQWETHATNNNVGYSSNQFDKLARTADVTWNAGKRGGLFNAAQQVLVDDAAWIPLYIPHRLVYISPSVLNLYLTGYGLIPRAGSWAQVQVRAGLPSQRAL